MQEPIESLWDVPTAAAYLGVATATLYSWVEQRPPRIPHLRIGRRVRFDPAELREWALAQRVGA